MKSKQLEVRQVVQNIVSFPAICAGDETLRVVAGDTGDGWQIDAVIDDGVDEVCEEFDAVPMDTFSGGMLALVVWRNAQDRFLSDDDDDLDAVLEAEWS